MRAALVLGGELHVADYGTPAHPLMRKLFRVVQAGDGYANTEPNATGVLPELMAKVGLLARIGDRGDPDADRLGLALPRRAGPLGARAADRRSRCSGSNCGGRGQLRRGEHDRVVEVRTRDAMATPHDTKVRGRSRSAVPWGAVANPAAELFQRLSQDPTCDSSRSVEQPYRRIQDTPARARRSIARFREKYGVVDWWYGLHLRLPRCPRRSIPSRRGSLDGGSSLARVLRDRHRALLHAGAGGAVRGSRSRCQRGVPRARASPAALRILAGNAVSHFSRLPATGNRCAFDPSPRARLFHGAGKWAGRRAYQIVRSGCGHAALALAQACRSSGAPLPESGVSFCARVPRAAARP
jgi:hypothetical protein